MVFAGFGCETSFKAFFDCLYLGFDNLEPPQNASEIIAKTHQNFEFVALQQINDKWALVSISCGCSKLAVVLLQPLCRGALLRQQPLHRVHLVLEELREVDCLQAEAEPVGDV